VVELAISYSGAQAWSDLQQVGPTAVVAIALLVAILLDLVLPIPVRGLAAAAVTVIGFLAAGAAAIYLLNRFDHPAYFGFARGDDFAAYFDLLYCLLGLLTVAVTHAYLGRRGFLQPEFYVLLLAATAGMMVMSSATSLVSVFLGLELLSVSLYVMSAFARRDTRSQEAGVKYLLMGGFASAFVLYGMALTYGATGTTVLPAIAQRVTQGDTGNNLLLVGVLLMAIGFAFKVSAAPFQMWTPDVYQGAPLPVTAFMSVGTKAAAFAMILRVFGGGLPHLQTEWQAALAFVAAASMIVGNVGAIAQSSVKRLLAYSGIAQAGYVLVGVLAGGAGNAAVLFYLFAYLFMNFGAFAIMVVLAGPEGDRDRLDDLDGLGFARPRLGVLMTLFMLSLAGFPPTVGFIGKFFLFTAGVQSGFTWLVILAVLMSVVSVYYYLRVVVHVWTPPPESALRPAVAPIAEIAIAVSGALTIVLGILPMLVLNQVASASP
jgi:NADH-quinone oxidoreductase subunit N